MAASSCPQWSPMGPPGYPKTRIQTPICRTRSAYRPVGVAAFILFVASVLVLLEPAAATSGMVLNDFVQHFEPLFYDRADVLRQHGRSKRESDSHLHLRFNAHNRLFKIRLRRSSGSVFADDAILESTQGPLSFDMDAIYEGQLEDDDQSSVSAVVTSGGHLDATVSTASETYYIEPSERYFAPSASNSSFPAVIYKASDVIHPEMKRPDGGVTCSSHEFYLKGLEQSKGWNCANCPQANNRSSPDAVIHDHDHNDHLDHNSVDWNQPTSRQGLVEFLANRQSHRHTEIDETLYSGWNRHHNERRKRRRSTVDPRKITCMLYLQADHLFFNKMGSEEACIETMTRHVQRVNAIYRNIDFDGDGQPDDINFMIKRIKVHTDQALNEPNYRFPGNYGVEKYLELFSEEDYDAFCLAYMFTYRDFEGGTLGLAWTGDLKNAGGVCEKNGHYRGSLKSLNTGIVTLLNYGKHVPPAVSHVTLAHEIGHNFGSPHDPEQNRDCTPGGEDGNYIMFARATSGDKKNNNKFSPCSLKSINGVLNAKARDAKGCFTEPQMAICGNGVVEPGEQCDCGWEEDCKEKCCYPMRSTPQPGEKPCTLRPYKKCSPSQGPCCTDDCNLRTNFKCRDDNGCRDSASCDGSGPKCPPSNNKPNKTVCNEEFVCFMGECTGSICIAYGLESCQCIPGPGDSPTKACELCCKLPGDDQPCRSSFEWNTPPYDVPDMHAKPGTPCSNYNGYCDVFQKCREVDPSGPLATLRRLLLSDESIASLKRWVEDHWYGVLFIAVGFISVVVAIARVFGKRVKLKMRKRRTSRTANGNAVQTNGTAAVTGTSAAAAVAIGSEAEQGHIVHPVAIRTKIPLKTKVREKHKRTKKPTAKPATKTPKANKIRPSKQLSIFGKPMVKSRKPRKEGDQRQRRSGVVSTTEKVQSWLERENPVQEAVDSDNESRFPEDNGSARNANVNAQVMRNAQSMPDMEQLTTSSSDRRESVGSKKTPPASGSHCNLMGLNGSEVVMRASSNSLSGPHHPAPNHLELPFNVPSGVRSSVVKGSKASNSKMMRSISECHGPHHPANKYTRSISAHAAHEAVADFKKLQRGSKTESHCHLLSKSELELDSKGNGVDVQNCANSSSFIPLQPKSVDPSNDELHHQEKEATGHLDRPESLDSITHPVVSVKIPKAGIPKSATDGKLKSAAKNRSSKFTSFEFLNFGARKSDKNKDGSVPQRPHTTSAAAKRPKEEDGSRIRAKALGLGPVKVVLKWHGTSRFNGLKSKRLPAKSTGEKKSAARKRVIVYSNPTTATGAMTADAAELASKHPKVDHDPIKSKANKAAAESSKVDLKLIPRNGTKASTNIITNPLDEANQVDHRLHPHHQANGADDGAFRSRRFSMQERASHPPNLSRNLSEMHRPPAHSKSNSSASVAMATRPSDQKRNRHSWASSRPSVELNGGHSVEHINIDMDSEECSQ